MKTLLKKALIVALACGAGASVQAIPTLRLTAGATVITITDGLLGDAAIGTPGAVAFFGPVGAQWVVNITTGITYPVGGLTPATPFISVDTSSSSLSAVTPDVLKIEFSETGFTGTDGLQVQFGGTMFPGGSLDSFAYADTGNTLWGHGPTLASLLGSTGAYSATAAAANPGTTPYSLTVEMNLTHPSGPANSTPGITIRSVPDGGSTLVLFGAALTLVGLLNRKRSKV